MENSTVIRVLDLKYFYQHKPTTYSIIISKLKERISNGETIQLVIDDSTSLIPANIDRLEKFLIDEVES